MMRNYKKLLRISLLAVGFMVVSFCAGCAVFDLPAVENLENLQFNTATQVFDVHGQLIAKLFEENRMVVSLNNISVDVQNAVIANEDSRFYKHIGIDPIGVLRAVWVDATSGNLAEGGSTITQQLAKNMFLTQERTVTRKFKEGWLALEIERKLSKQEILQAYLNQIYFGEGAYGIEAAAQTYFGKHANALSLAESALLAGLPRGPSLYSPYANMKAAKDRQAAVLAGMVKEGYITRQQADEAMAESLKLQGKKKRSVQASYFLDYIAKDLVSRYGEDLVYKGGLKVYTTLDIKVQQAAEEALGDRQGGVVSLDPRNGYIVAMVGGRNYRESQINRVISEVRQPGSAFKPFVYTTALNGGLAENSLIVDEPIDIDGYRPNNYDKTFHGAVTMKKALRDSINVAAVKTGQQFGMDQVLGLGRSMGLTTLVDQDNNLAAALGGLTRGVNLFELCTAYTAFANGGVLSHPIGIIKVVDANNRVLEENRLAQESVLRPDIAYLMTDMLKGVVESGTGTAANIGRPAAGKTGTTDNYETAWFIGYTPELLTGIYVGNDDRTPVNISGSEVAGLWGKMMTKALRGVPATDFTVPADVVTGVAVCSDSGKLAVPGVCEFERSAFIRGTEPTELDDRLKLGPFLDKQPTDQEKARRPWWKRIFSRLPNF